MIGSNFIRCTCYNVALLTFQSRLMAIKVGSKISNSNFVILFVRYYRNDESVKEDVELQAYLNEVSLDGTGPNGGIGQVY